MLQRKKNNWKGHLRHRICYSSDTFTCPGIEGHTVRKLLCIWALPEDVAGQHRRCLPLNLRRYLTVSSLHDPVVKAAAGRPKPSTRGLVKGLHTFVLVSPCLKCHMTTFTYEVLPPPAKLNSLHLLLVAGHLAQVSLCFVSQMFGAFQRNVPLEKSCTGVMFEWEAGD